MALNTDEQNIDGLAFECNNTMTVGISDGNTVTLDFGNLNTDEQNIDAFRFECQQHHDLRHHGRDEPYDLLGGLEYRRTEL